ncbi:helix-turn-helix domain-containing protein [Paenibacillus sp. HJL G12]|uniref:Helix-turn-helix domain-containing protein n=1 Tax=Paenibacillus dendrobii TaxID=2691084 RepID=A0A7X3IHA1_9BACL|nr:AraC family transcriptional regulator [Paenibacillus dendrobii]MWV43917.1 helix-turn-helix domain-containing protein [Paenibacillus dendrobii]
MATTYLRDIYDHYFLGMNPYLGAFGENTDMVFTPYDGEGSIQRMSTTSGIEIVISDYHLSDHRSITLASKSAMVELSFCLEGAGGFSISGRSHELSPGTCSLQFMNHFQAVFEYAKSQPVRSLALGIPVSLYARFMHGCSAGEKMDFSSILGETPFRIYQKPIDSAVSDILLQMLACPYSHATRSLYLEAKSLELLSIYFERFFFEKGQPSGTSHLSRSDRDKIQQAALLLITSMESPPSLLGLSRLVGLNDFKLKHGFKEIFGTTVFGYLREQRMLKAMSLLEKGNVTISSVAAQVGYANASHFTEAFRLRFGVNPSEWLRMRS